MVLGGVLSSLEKEHSFTHLFIHRICIKHLPCAMGSAGVARKMKKKMDMVTNPMSWQSNEGDRKNTK